MSMGMEVGVFLAYAFGMLMVYVFGRFLLVPLKWIVWCVVSSLAGGAVILLINGLAGFVIPLNIITAAIAGILGVPGVIMLTVFFF